MKTPKTPTSKTHHKLLSWLVIISLALNILAGCSSTDKPDSESLSDTEEISSEADSTTSEPESAPESPESASTPPRPLTPEEIEALYEPIDEQVTVMVYLTGSDLESAAGAGSSDMQEMAESGIDLTRVNLLVFTGGAPAWHSENPEIPTDRNMLYHLTENGYEAVEEFDQLSMGDPANLTRFLEYSYEHYPADSYDLILWDHGNGPVIGYGSDKQYNGDTLTLQEIKEALSASPFGEKASAPQRPEGAGETPHISLLGFDACLMSSAELACTVDDYADYMVASQETEPSFGWNYSFLRMCGKISTKDLAAEIVRSYSEYCENYFAGNEFFQSDYTLAVIDLAHARQLQESIDALFEKASEDVSGSYNGLAAARVRSHGFGRASTGSEYDLVDLESLAQQMEERYPKEVSSLREAIDNAVVTTKSNIGESCGLSLFYPYYNKNYYRKTWRTQYQTMALDTFPSYSTYLSRFDQVWLGADLLEVYEGELTLQQGESSGTYTLQLTPEQYENYASSRYIIFRRITENLYTIVYISKDITDKKGLLTANFDGKVIYFEDDYGKKGIPTIRMFETVDGVTDFDCFAVATRKSDDPDKVLGDRLFCDIQFAVNTSTSEVTIKGVYEDETSTDDTETADTETADTIISGKRTPVDLSEWTTMEFYDAGSRYLTRDAEGRILPYSKWPDSGWASYYQMPLANGLHFTYEPLYDDGNEYFVMFEVSDVQNNRVYSEMMPITLAAAPPEELAKEATQIEWNGGSSVTILEEADPTGLFLELRVINDQEYRRTGYMLHAVNNNEYGARIFLSNIYLNGSISYRHVGEFVLPLYLDPGEEEYVEIEDVGSILTFAGLDTPESLQFVLEAVREDNGGYIIYNRPYFINVTGEITPQNYFVPVLGALADSQVLYEENGLRVELLGLGNYSSYKGSATTWQNLLAKTKFTNQSGEEQNVFVVGLEVNGIFYEKLEICKLQDGESWDKTLTVDYENLLKIDSNYAQYDREERLQEISEINLIAVANGVIHTLPIALSQQGAQERFEVQGELLYEDEQIRVTLDSAGTGQNYNKEESYLWELWVENISNKYQPYEIYMKNENGRDTFLSASKLAPDTKQLVQVGRPAAELPDKEMQIYFKSQYDDTAATDLITLTCSD